MTVRVEELVETARLFESTKEQLVKARHRASEYKRSAEATDQEVARLESRMEDLKKVLLAGSAG